MSCQLSKLKLPVCHNFEVARAAHFEHIWENIVDIDGEPWDWDGYEAKMTLQYSEKGPSPFAEFDTSENLGPAGGPSLILYTGINNNPESENYDPSTIMIDRVMPEAKLVPVRSVFYALWVINPVGISRPWFKGKILFKEVAQHE